MTTAFSSMLYLGYVTCFLIYHKITLKSYHISFLLLLIIIHLYFVKWCSHNEIQSNSEVYSSFASIYINPVVYCLLIKVAWGASVWVAYINLLISGAKVKWGNYFTKSLHAIFKLLVMGFLLCSLKWITLKRIVSKKGQGKHVQTIGKMDTII